MARALTGPVARWLLALALLPALGCGALGVLNWHISDEAQLEAAKSRWAARPFDAYRLSVLSGETCELDVAVRGEQVIQVLHEEPCSSAGRTVSDLFRLLERSRETIDACVRWYCACRNTLRVYAVYDPQLGYPRRIAVRAERAINWTHPSLWRYVLRYGALPDCLRDTDAQIVAVRALTPLP